MRVRLVAAAALVAFALVCLTAWVLDMSVGRAATLAPIIVLTFGAAVGLVLLWVRVALDPILRRRRAE